MAEPFPIVLVPGLLTSPRLFSGQLPALWRHGPVTIADNTRDDTIGAIDRPTLVLVGDSDQLTPPELSAEIAEGIPGARLVVVAGAGHLTTLDQPDQVTAALVEWLQA